MIALPTAYPGTASKIPKNPAKLPAASKIVMIVSGCTLSCRPIIFGVIKFESVCWAINVMSDTQITNIGSWKNPISSAGINAIHGPINRSEEHTSELQSRFDIVCRLLLEKKKKHETQVRRTSGN